MAQTTTHRCSFQVREALDYLKRGGAVVLPTDTLYGLAVDILNPAAVQRVFAIKGRSSDLALPILVDDWAGVEMVASHRSNLAQQLAESYWPGPLTLVLPKRTGISDLVTGGRETVAVRSPDHWVPRRLIEQLGRPLTGTSANISGSPDPNSLAEVRASLGSLVDYIISCGPSPMGTSSTIVDVTGDSPKLIREGAIPFQEILNSG